MTASFASAANRPKVLIVGGGLAGLATAVALADFPVAVHLVESRPRLGGRASSFFDPTAEDWIDNCQHVSMGCCVNLEDFCRRVGIADGLSTEPTLYFHDESGRISPLYAVGLPSPFHLAPAFLRARFLGVGDKLRIGYGLWRLLRDADGNGGSFRDWLLANGQSPRTCERFWSMVLTSALNESLDRIDYRYARQVFVEGFLANRKAFVVRIPRVALEAFYGAQLRDWLARKGITVSLGMGVAGLEIADDQVAGCRLRNSEEILVADGYVAAVAHHHVRDLLPASDRDRWECFSRLAAFDSSPISSVHLWYDRVVMDLPHLAPVGRTVQWLFRRQSEPNGGNGAPTGQYLQAVISCARELTTLGKERIRDLIAQEVAQILPRAATAKLVHWRVVTERSATYSVVPGVDRLRPLQATPIANLWLAGDYTQTDWPATMEGAVRSGYLAAESILRRWNLASESLLAQPLPTEWLIRQLLAKSTVKTGDVRDQMLVNARSESGATPRN